MNRLGYAVAIFAAWSGAACGQTDSADEGLADRGVQMIEARDAAIKRAVDRGLPSVVAVVLRQRDSTDLFDGGRFEAIPSRDTEDQDLTATAVGGGVILDETGRILTCHHLARLAYFEPAKYELVVR